MSVLKRMYCCSCRTQACRVMRARRVLITLMIAAGIVGWVVGGLKMTGLI